MQTIIYNSRLKGLWIFLISILFVALGYFTWQKKPTLQNDHNVASIVAMVFFGLCSVVTLYMMLVRKPMLLIDEKGIVINPEHKKSARILWSEIAGFNAISINRNKMITIIVHDPETLIGSQSGFIKKQLMHFNMRYGGPYAINSNITEMKHLELLELLNRELIKNQSA